MGIQLGPTLDLPQPLYREHKSVSAEEEKDSRHDHWVSGGEGGIRTLDGATNPILP